jgi:hypothetical protein
LERLQTRHLLSTLMAAARAKSAAFIRLIHDNNNELKIHNNGDDDVGVDDDDDLVQETKKAHFCVRAQLAPVVR